MFGGAVGGEDLVVSWVESVASLMCYCPPAHLSRFEHRVSSNLERCIASHTNALVARAEIEELGTTVVCKITVHEVLPNGSSFRNMSESAIWTLQTEMERQQVLFEAL
jgi:hypothetical protein